MDNQTDYKAAKDTAHNKLGRVLDDFLQYKGRSDPERDSNFMNLVYRANDVINEYYSRRQAYRDYALIQIYRIAVAWAERNVDIESCDRYIADGEKQLQDIEQDSKLSSVVIKRKLQQVKALYARIKTQRPYDGQGAKRARHKKCKGVVMCAKCATDQLYKGDFYFDFRDRKPR